MQSSIISAAFEQRDEGYPSLARPLPKSMLMAEIWLGFSWIEYSAIVSGLRSGTSQNRSRTKMAIRISAATHTAPT